MKNFKFAFLLAFAAIIGLTSCDKSSVDAVADGESAVMDMIFLATTDDSTGTFRGHRGKCNITEVAAEDLPATVTDYITANYAGSTIERAGTNDAGTYIVKIMKEDGTYAGLAFDADGSFLAEKTHKSKGTSVAAEDLPAAITDYIASDYAGATLHKARLFDDGTYAVLIIQADETYLGLGFDADGNFVAELSMKDRKGKKHGPGKRMGH